MLAIPSAHQLAKGLAGIRAARARRRWREVEAEIVSTDLDDGPGREFSVVYRFSVDGREYTNDHIVPGRDSAREPDSISLFHQYPLHRRTIVFYDPEDPSQSALDPGSDEIVLRPIIVGTLGVVMSGVWLLMIVTGWP